jgi:hypothetical protein
MVRLERLFMIALVIEINRGSNMNTKRIQAGKYMYLFFAAIYTLCVISQFFTAGLAVFVSPANWGNHFAFVHMFGYTIPLLLLICAFIGSLPKSIYWHLFGLGLLMFVMYFTANMRGHFPLIGAAHPIAGLLLLGLACSNLNTIAKIIFIQEKKGDE